MKRTEYSVVSVSITPSPPSDAVVVHGSICVEMLVAESRIVIIDHLPALLPREAFVQQRQDLWHVELDIFQVQVILIVLLHLKQIIKLEIQFK